MLNNSSNTDQGSKRASAATIGAALTAAPTNPQRVPESWKIQADKGLAGMGVRQILICGDDHEDLEVIGQALEGISESPLMVDFIVTSSDVIAHCLSKDYDALLMLLPEPAATGFKLLEQLQRNLPALPVVVLAPGSDTEMAAHFLLQGAQDFLYRHVSDAHLIRRTLDHARFRKQHVLSSTSARGYDGSISARDSITGLPGRAQFCKTVSELLSYGDARGQQAALLLVDLDGYSAVIRELGVGIGEQLLKIVSERMRGLLPSSAMTAHFGGSIFAVAVPDIGGSKNAVRVARSITGAVAQPVVVEGHGIGIGSRVGISLFPRHGQDLDTLIRNADTAMVHDGSLKRNELRIFQREKQSGFAD
jgi:diguanylate cyclase (GGDEF)-like protein